MQPAKGQRAVLGHVGVTVILRCGGDGVKWRLQLRFNHVALVRSTLPATSCAREASVVQTGTAAAHGHVLQ